MFVGFPVLCCSDHPVAGEQMSCLLTDCAQILAEQGLSGQVLHCRKAVVLSKNRA